MKEILHAAACFTTEFPTFAKNEMEALKLYREEDDGTERMPKLSLGNFTVLTDFPSWRLKRRHSKNDERLHLETIGTQKEYTTV